MKESDFINKNKKKWQDFEKQSIAKNTDLLKTYAEISLDASIANTYYKHRSIKVYLNFLLAKIEFSLVNKQTKLMPNYLFFWKNTVPKAMYESRWMMLIVFLVFSVFVAAGYFSAAKDVGFSSDILGSGYVITSLENIKSGDPMAIYGSMPEFDMFVTIAFNNIKVGLVAFSLGALFGIGSLFSMVINGIMLGVFMHFFYSRGVAGDFNLAVWMHGTFEIAMLIIESGAGFVMGLGLINKGNFSTKQSFYNSAKKGVQILIATIPFTILAAVIEAFLTRYTQLPAIVRASFIVLCLLITLFYFVIYPYLLYKKGRFNKDESFDVLDNSVITVLPFLKFKKPLEIATEIFGLYSKHILKNGLFFSILGIVTIYLMEKDFFEELKFGAISGISSSEKFFNMFYNLGQLPENLMIFFQQIICLPIGLFLGCILYFVFNKVLPYYTNEKRKFSILKCVAVSFATVLLFLAFYNLPLIINLAFLIYYMNLIPALFFEENFNKAIYKSLTYGLSRFNLTTNVFSAFILAIFVAYLLHSPLFWTIQEVVNIFYVKEDLSYQTVISVLITFLMFTVIYFFFICYLLSNAATYLFNKEFYERSETKRYVANMVLNDQILGFEKE